MYKYLEAVVIELWKIENGPQSVSADELSTSVSPCRRYNHGTRVYPTWLASGHPPVTPMSFRNQSALHHLKCSPTPPAY